MPAETTNIKVAVRVRPYNRRELESSQRCIIKVLDKTSLLFDPDEDEDEFFFQGVKQKRRDITKRVNKKLTMEFDRVFDVDANNVQIFEECTMPLVDAVLNGFNCSVFVYGATGAGKTFTMLGNSSCAGLTFLTMRDLFEKINEQSDVRKFDVGVTYLEVYNEQVMNLLTKTGPLKLLEDSSGVLVSGLKLTPITNAEGLLQLLALGNNNRTQHPTDANAESSRSHAVFQVHIRITDKKTTTKRTVKLSMIDLAGSERAASTKGLGLRFKEGANINKSLLALGNCINKLADGLKHIPYRDSNLTRLLKDSLGGNCQTLMVANISMSSLTYEDTYNTLKYASRAKKIRTTLRQNTLQSNMPKDYYLKKVNELTTENERLKNLLKAKDEQITALEKAISSPTLRTYDEKELKSWYTKIDAVYSSVVKSQEYVIGLESKGKSLSLTNTLREQSEQIVYMLSQNQKGYHEEHQRFKEIASELNQQNDKINEELMRWRKKLQDSFKDVDKLKKEVKQSKYANILKVYLRAKEMEVKYSKQNVVSEHIRGVNREIVAHNRKMRDMLVNAFTIVQNSYHSAKENLEVNTELEAQYLKLQELLKSEFSPLKDDANVLQRDELLGKRSIADNDDNDDDDNEHAAKRLRNFDLEDFNLNYDEIETETDSDGCDANKSTVSDVFKVPASKTFNPNETRVLSTIDENSGGDHCVQKNTNATTHKRQLVNDMLSADIVRAPANKEHLKSILMKSKNFEQELHKKKEAIKKENIKKVSPRGVRKSPRSQTKNAMPFTARAQILKTTNNGEPLVRTNRAAAFRFKK